MSIRAHLEHPKHGPDRVLGEQGEHARCVVCGEIWPCPKVRGREIRGERIAERVEGRRKIDVVNSGFSDHAPGDGWQYDRTTTGWSSCGCPGTDGIRLDGYHTGTGWRPGHVLDPFGGSGTTAVVATGRGRDCTLIDLDVRNAQLARERLGMFLEVDDPTTEGAA